MTYVLNLKDAPEKDVDVCAALFLEMSIRVEAEKYLCKIANGKIKVNYPALNIILRKKLRKVGMGKYLMHKGEVKNETSKQAL